MLALVCFMGIGLTLLGLSRHLNLQAEQAVEERAEIILAATQAARNYTRDYIQPILKDHSPSADALIQESIPNFAARKTFADFQGQNAKFEDFLYKEASPNPTNRSDLTDGFEQALFLTLQQQSTDETSAMLSGYRTVEGEKLFYLARPLIMADASCLECHGNPLDAPPSLIDMYGNQNGFNWELNSVVAAQMVYVPADTIFARGRQNLFTVAKTLLSIFGVLFLMINLLLWKTVINPLKRLTHVAKRISSCSVNPPQTFHDQDNDLSALTIRRDEPGQLARAFEYMLYVLGRREQDLQQAVRERTHSLEQEMRDRQRAQDALKTYSHAINHDLRNLVMGISTVIQGIRFKALKQRRVSAGCAPDPSDDQSASTTAEDSSSALTSITVNAEALTLVQSSCDRQIKLMDSLMEVQSSDIWRIALQPERVDLKRLVDSFAAVCTPKFEVRQATFENQIPADLPAVHGDPSQLKRVFENLIDNALKHNSSGVVVTVQAAWDTATPTQIRCWVADNGIGIDPEKAQALFQIYTRGQADNQAPGSGLGLYICKQIVEAHGGAIGVEISESKGAAFWLTLPRTGG